jgi:hypothetical protein
VKCSYLHQIDASSEKAHYFSSELKMLIYTNYCALYILKIFFEINDYRLITNTFLHNNVYYTNVRIEISDDDDDDDNSQVATAQLAYIQHGPTAIQIWAGKQ